MVAVRKAALKQKTFQCSSASRKFLNRRSCGSLAGVARRFSALQRAENSSIEERSTLPPITWQFQCSSASRKFLNRKVCCERSISGPVSVLFSEPKIPQFKDGFASMHLYDRFSALQRAENSSIPVVETVRPARVKFQCSSASRKFLNTLAALSPPLAPRPVSVLFSEPKIPQ